MATSPARTIVIIGGELYTDPDVEPDDLVISADSGYDHALRLGLEVDLLIGDLDSISPTGLAHANQSHVDIEQHPTDKDETDLELALRSAAARDAETVDIHGGEGGSFGHLLGVALTLTHPDWADMHITWHTSRGAARGVIPGHALAFGSMPEDVVTLLPVGTTEGITSTGLRWPLTDATIERGSSRGVSNVATGEEVTIEIRTGALLVVHEGSDRK